MIRSEHPVIMADGSENYGLIKHYSDSGRMIKQIETGDIYGEAVDLYPCRYTYEETGEPEELTDTEALRLITGGAPDAT